MAERVELTNSKPTHTPLCLDQKLCRSGVVDGEESITLDNIPYREIVGCLVYLSSCSRPDIAYAVGIVAQYCAAPKPSHWSAVKHIVRYLLTTLDRSIIYTSDSNNLELHTDADFASDVDSRKSTTGYVIKMAGGPISWRSRKQPTAASSTTEAELIAASESCKEILWLQQLLSPFGYRPPTPLFIDNQSTIRVISQEKSCSKMKHVAVKHMFLKEQVENNKVELIYVPTE